MYVSARNNTEPEFILKETSDESKIKSILKQNKNAEFFKTVNVTKDKEKINICCNFKRTKGA